MTPVAPAPDDFALAEAAAPADDFALAGRETPLTPVIRAEIQAAGRITFARFMALALGHAEHGYYSRPGLRWGAAGDYETSPEVHAIFGFLWARQVLECWERLDRPASFEVVEPGAGSGAFAGALLSWLRERAPHCFAAARPVLLDGHPVRLEEQRRALEARGLEAEHALVEDWLAREEPVTGVVISNEFFDALPVHLVEQHDDVLHEWYVEDGAEGFRFALGPASTRELERHFERLGLRPGEGCRAEVSLAAGGAMRRLAARIERGYVLTIDYGKEARDLYASWRREGTLMAFRNHSPQPDPLATPGLLDLTAHVDLTSLAAAAVEHGFEAAPTVSQAEALTALGLPEALRAAAARAHEDVARYAAEKRAAATLVDPAGLGRIRVLVLAKGAPLDGLRCLRPLGPGA
jgi:SAM-dependent MidA family methyltransferase